MKLLVIYRHGERSDEAPLHRQVEFECVSDAPLTEIGHEQASIAAQSIKDLVPASYSVHLVSSPLIRCLQTAAKLAKVLNTEVYVEEGFGESYCQHHFPIDPFENLHIRVRPDLFEHTLQGVTFIENQHAYRPKNPESPEELDNRMKIMMEYVLNRSEDAVIICSHFLPVKKFTEIVGGDTKIESQHTLITAAQWDGENFSVIKNGCFQHLPQRLVKPIP